MTKPEEEGPFFITEEIEAEMRAAGYVFEVPDRICLRPGPGDDPDYDKWFLEQVDAAIQEAEDPNTKWVSNEDAKESWAKQRAEIVEQATNGKPRAG